MYKSDEELFAQAMAACDLPDHPRFSQLSALVSTMLAVGIADLSEASHEDVLVICKQLGYVLEAHADVQLVVDALTKFAETTAAHEAELLREPFRPYDALFYRDRHGQLMATFQMGPKRRVRVPLDEAWERKFALVYQSALRAIEEGEADGLYDAEDGDSDEG